MNLDSLILIEVADTPDQYRRAYELNVNADTLSALDFTLRNEGNKYKPSMLVDVLGNSIGLSADGVERVNLDEGRWGDERYRYIATVTVEEPTPSHGGSRIVVCGYTDRCDVSYNKTVAPDLKMYINSIVGIRDILVKDRRGNSYIKSTVTENYQVLLGSYEHGANRLKDYKMRPVDVFSTIETTRELGVSDDQTVDTRITFDSGVDTNSRRNNQRGRYLSSLIDQDVQGYRYIETYANDEFGETISRNSAAAEIGANSERRIIANNFIRYLTSNCNSDVLYNKHFEYRDMAALTATGTLRSLDDVTTIIERGNGSLSMESENWKGGTTETVVAATLSQEIPSIMTDCIVSSISFQCSNTDSRTGHPEFICTDLKMFVHGDFGDYIIDAFEQRFLNEVFIPLSNHGHTSLDIQVSADVGGMTVVDIIIDNNPNERFVFPSFCDSVLAPTMTNNYQKLEDLVFQYEEIRTKIVNPILLDVAGDPIAPRATPSNDKFIKLF